MNNRKSLLFAYVFSLVGGLIGLHHLYLDRSQHALLWATTFGGFGIGFIYEFLFLIKKYVQEANYDRFILNQYMLEMTRKKSPAFEISRLCGKKIDDMYIEQKALTIVQSFKSKINILNDSNILE